MLRVPGGTDPTLATTVEAEEDTEVKSYRKHAFFRSSVSSVVVEQLSVSASHSSGRELRFLGHSSASRHVSRR